MNNAFERVSSFVLYVYQASCVCSLISLNAIFRPRLVIVLRSAKLRKWVWRHSDGISQKPCDAKIRLEL